MNNSIDRFFFIEVVYEVCRKTSASKLKKKSIAVFSTISSSFGTTLAPFEQETINVVVMRIANNS